MYICHGTYKNTYAYVYVYVYIHIYTYTPILYDVYFYMRKHRHILTGKSRLTIVGIPSTDATRSFNLTRWNQLYGLATKP